MAGGVGSVEKRTSRVGDDDAWRTHSYVPGPRRRGLGFAQESDPVPQKTLRGGASDHLGGCRDWVDGGGAASAARNAAGDMGRTWEWGRAIAGAASDNRDPEATRPRRRGPAILTRQHTHNHHHRTQLPKPRRTRRPHIISKNDTARHLANCGHFSPLILRVWPPHRPTLTPKQTVSARTSRLPERWRRHL